MSQLARRENAPHRAAFVTSLSRWYICRLLGNLPPFHPCLSAESEAPFCPLRNIVTLRAYSLEIKVRQAISVFLSVYPELIAVMGSKVPDYRGKFLRTMSSGHSVGEKVANSIKSHNHTQPTHTHTFSGQLVSTALSGTAAGQRYTDNHTGIDGRWGTTGPEWSESFGISYVADVYVSGEGVNFSVTRDFKRQTSWLETRTKTASSSSVTGNLRNGAVSGSIGAGGGIPTDYTGSSETAPDHIYVRCLIRAKP